MKLIVGLGNPGTQYQKTRHNIGFAAVEALAKSVAWKNKKRWNALSAEGEISGEKILFLKPQTFMNKSGDAVRQALNYHKLNVEDAVVVYDDIDLPVGMVRFRSGGSAGGHQGMQSVLTSLGTDGVPRIKIGIAEETPGKQNIPSEEYVLKPFSKKGEQGMAAVLEKFPALVENWFEKKFGENDTWALQ
ncbi:MAG: aminoacyl-tRNA hydrolase [Parcubacteria group bacterium]|nr:aminoacyl-tRNA hydrolase [Parcubacteria group bacterium]